MILSAESVSAVCFEQVYNDYENKSSCIYDGAMTYRYVCMIPYSMTMMLMNRMMRSEDFLEIGKR